MKKVRFVTPNKNNRSIMSDLESHSPRPFVDKQVNAIGKELCYVYDSPKTVEFSNDCLKLYESSNSSPYNNFNKTDLQKSLKMTECKPSIELDLSMLDAGSEHNTNFKLQEGSKCVETEKPVFATFSSENIKRIPCILKRNSDDFFITHSNLRNNQAEPIKQFTGHHLNTNADFKFKKAALSHRVPELQSIPSHYRIQPGNTNPSLNYDCKCHHCDKENISGVRNIEENERQYDINNKRRLFEQSHQQVDLSKAAILNSAYDCDHCFNANHKEVQTNLISHVLQPKELSVPIKNMKMSNEICRDCNCRQVLLQPKCFYCECNSGPWQCKKDGDLVNPRNIVHKKKWAIERFENCKSHYMDIDKQTTVKEKREPTVADLFKIIKLQNEQLVQLQEKVDKFIKTNSCNSQTMKNFVSEQMTVKTLEDDHHKISIGVMTSFERVCTSTIVNKEILSYTDNQIKLNNPQIRLKEVVDKSVPENRNFLDGLTPVKKAVQSNDEFDNCNTNTVDNRNEEKTMNDYSLNNINIDNTTTPIMSPDQTLYLDVRDYTDSESSCEEQSNVGWTYYNKIMNQVNGILHDSDMPSSASALYRNTRQQCVQMQIDKTNFSISKRVKFGEDLQEIYQNNYGATTDTSLKMNELAAKYLKNTPLTPMMQQLSVKAPALPIDVSLATRNYMERHHLIKVAGTKTAAPNPPYEMPKFLDITALKKQPKLL